MRAGSNPCRFGNGGICLRRILRVYEPGGSCNFVRVQVESQWILIETLEPPKMGVVAVGNTVKKRVALASFIRGPHRSAVLRVAAQAFETASPIEDSRSIPGTIIVAEPVISENNRVHGLWLRVAADNAGAPPIRNAAWTIAWYLDRGISTRPDEDLPGEPLPDGERYWSIAEAMSTVDLGRGFADAAAVLARAEVGSAYQDTVVRRARGGRDDLVGFVAVVTDEPTSPDGSERERVVRGLTIRLGPVPDSPKAHPKSVTDVAARAILNHSVSKHGEYAAICVLDTFAISRWVGPPHPYIAWQISVGDAVNGLDEGYVDSVRTLTQRLTASEDGEYVDAVLGYRGPDGVLRTFDISATRVPLDDTTSAAVAVFTLTRD